MIKELVVRKALFAALLATGALGFALQTSAQSTSGDHSGASTTRRPAAAQGSPSQTSPSGNSYGTGTTAPSGQSTSQGPMANKTIPPSRSETADSAFEKLDAGHKGYLTQDDAKSMTGFDRSFQSADADHDGKLTGAEFKKAWTAYTGNPQ